MIGLQVLAHQHRGREERRGREGERELLHTTAECPARAFCSVWHTEHHTASKNEGVDAPSARGPLRLCFSVAVVGHVRAAAYPARERGRGRNARYGIQDRGIDVINLFVFSVQMY